MNEYADAAKEFFRHVADGYKAAISNGNLHIHSNIKSSETTDFEPELESFVFLKTGQSVSSEKGHTNSTT